MNIEFHYYITYILAIKAGFSPAGAQIIAYSAQYTDDNTKKFVINKGKSDEYRNYISQTYDILKPKEEHIRIYPCFHFVPGDFKNKSTNRNDKKIHPLNTTANSKNANILIDDAFRSNNLYRIGIATHCYTDTWAHQNFVGCNDSFNGIFGLLEFGIPDIGHADAMHKPDIPFLIWDDPRLVKKNKRIRNKLRFLEAARFTFNKYCKYVDPKIKINHIKNLWEHLEPKLIWAMGKESKWDYGKRKKRVARYKSVVEMKEYKKNTWFNQAIKSKKLLKLPDFENKHWFKFQEAVKEHQRFAIDLLKPRFKQIGLMKISNF